MKPSALPRADARPHEAWRRNQLAVNIAAGLVFFGFTLVMPFLPLYVADLGVKGMARIALWSGLLLSTPPMLAALLGPFWGRVADRTGMKLMVSRVLVTMTVIWGLMYFARNVYEVLALRIVLGIFSGFSAMSAALVTHGSPRESISRSIGSLQATQILSTAVGPLVGGILYALVGIRNVFLITSLCCVVALLLILALYRDVPAEIRTGEESESAPVDGNTWAAARSIQGFTSLIPFLFLVNLVDRSFPTVIPLLVISMVGDAPRQVAATSGLLVTSYAISAAISAYLLGRMTLRQRPGRILVTTMTGSACLTALMLVCRTPGQFLVLRVLSGLLVGGAITVGYSAGGALIPSRRRAALYGLLSSAALMGGAVGPMVSGALVGIHLRAPFVAASLIYAGLVIWTLSRLRELPTLAKPAETPASLAAKPVNQA